MSVEIIGAFAIGFAATLLGSIATGANLISIPGLIFLGASPLEAIASSRPAAVTGGAVTVYRYNKAGMVIWRYVPYLLVTALLAGVIGPKLVLLVPTHAMKLIVAVLLVASLPLLFMRKAKFGEQRRTTSRIRKLVGLMVLLIVMIYSTAFVAGGGTLIMYVLSYFFGLTLSEGNATGQVVWAAGAGVALVAYLSGGAIVLSLAIPMLIGSTIGGNFGAKLAIKKGVGWVKYVLAGVIIVSSVVIFFS